MMLTCFNGGAESCVVCSSALKITAQETIHQLQSEIKFILEGLPFVRYFQGFDVVDHKGKVNERYCMHAYAQQSELDVSHLVEHKLAQQSLESKEIQCLEQNHGWLCFIPVSSSDDVNALWVLEYEKGDSKPNLTNVELLLNVYQNCASHIGLQNTDALTGLENRQALSDRLSRMLKGHRRAKDVTDHTLPNVCMLDIDFFKRVNDDYGHLYGDEVLLLFADLMKNVFRENDYLYRYGGEEFIVLLDTSRLEESLIALERFRSAVESYNFPQVKDITVSIGFVPMSMGELPSATLDKADKALYYSKQNGRNQVNSYQVLLDKGLLVEEKLSIDSELF